MQIIDSTQNLPNDKSILEENETEIRECMTVKTSYKRNFKEFISTEQQNDENLYSYSNISTCSNISNSPPHIDPNIVSKKFKYN